jgi:hypothetical protein
MNEGETTSEELRELIRLGHGMIKDLRQVQREARATIAELEAKVEEFRNVPHVVVTEVMQPVIQQHMEQIAKDVATTTVEVTEFVESKVYERFDLLMAIILGEDNSHGVSIPKALLGKIRPPKIDLSQISDSEILGLGGPIERKQQ